MSKTYPCIYCTDDLKCTKYTDDEVTSFCVLGPCHDEKPSNGDKIRVMSDEELADFLTGEDMCELLCSAPAVCPGHCKTKCLEWLKKEADNG